MADTEGALVLFSGGQPLVDLVLEVTHRCYLGDRTHGHAWGYGCGSCPACLLRQGGWDRYRAEGGSR